MRKNLTFADCLASFLAPCRLLQTKQQSSINVYLFFGIQHKPSVEHVIAHDKMRMERLEKLLENRRRQLQDHHSGRRLLDEKEHAAVTRSVNNYQRKLDILASETMAHKLDKLEEHTGEAWKNMNTLDYIDLTRRD